MPCRARADGRSNLRHCVLRSRLLMAYLALRSRRRYGGLSLESQMCVCAHAPRDCLPELISVHIRMICANGRGSRWIGVKMF